MRWLAIGLFVLAACGTVIAQPPPGLPSPRLQFVFPPGAKAGPAPSLQVLGQVIPFPNEVVVTGTDLEEPEKLLFSHPGIKGEYLAPKLPVPDPKKKDTPPPPNPGPHKFKVTVEANVPPGTYDVRFVGKWGVTNPRAFVVGNLTEVYEKEPNNDVPDAQRVEIGTTINGVITTGTDVDYSVFAGKKGQRVVVSCLASSIDSRANPTIEVFDPAGRKLATNRNYRDTDAVTDLIVPVDGDYYVRLSQFTYQGGATDYVYRLTISTAPWIDAVFPPAIEPGKPTPVTLYGRNLPNGQPADGFTVDGRPLEKLTVTITPPTDPTASTRLTLHTRIDPGTALQDGFEYVFQAPNGIISNPVPIHFTRDKLVLKKNVGGTTPATAESIPAPCEVAGFLSRRGDSDWYAFEAKKGEQLMIEVNAERDGTAADFFLSVRDGKDPKRDLSGELDDDPDSLHPFGFYTRTGDPAPYKFVAPEDGKYLILVGCRESGVVYGPRTAYRLRVSPAKPDYRAIVMPYSRHFQTGAVAWQGGNQAYDVLIHRIDGYSGPVTVVAEGLPGGVTAKPITIGPNTRWGILVLNAAPTAAAYSGAIVVKATGTTADGKPLVREVRPASVTWGSPQPQANIPVIARLDQSLVLAVRPEKAMFTIVPDLMNATTKLNGKDEKLPAPLTVKQGEKLTIPVKVNWISPDKQAVALTVEPNVQNPPSSPVTAQIATQPTKEKPEAVVNLDVKAAAPPGTYTITLKGVAQVPYAKDPMAKQKPNVPAEILSDPIDVTVIPTALAKVTAGTLPGNTLKIGTSGELLIKVDRQYDYAGEFKVKFELPKGVTGVTAAEVTIPAGKDEAKLVLKAPADAKPGAVSNAIVTVTATYAGKYPIAHEVKVTFTVAK